MKTQAATIIVKPREGARVRQPNRNNRVMPPEGDRVSEDDVFYSRLILSGDLVVVAETVKHEPAPFHKTQRSKE